jgi:hypothetical protein
MKTIRFFAVALAILAAITLPFATPANAQADITIYVNRAIQPTLPLGYVLEEPTSQYNGTTDYQFYLGSLKQWRLPTQNILLGTQDQKDFGGCVDGEKIYEYLYDTHPEILGSFLSLQDGEQIFKRLQLEPDGGIKLFKKLYGNKFPFSVFPFTWENNTAVYFWRSVALDHASDQRMVPYMKIKKEKGKEELIIDWSPVNNKFFHWNPALKFSNK